MQFYAVSIPILGFIEYLEPLASAPVQLSSKRCLVHHGLNNFKLEAPSTTHRTTNPNDGSLHTLVFTHDMIRDDDSLHTHTISKRSTQR